MNINTAATMTAIMKTVIQSGTGRAANIGKPAAGKTGTTDDCKDAYFIGFTPDVVTGVWVGNDDNSRMGELTGGTVPAKIWRDVMLVATEPYGNSDFEYPEIILKPFKASKVSVITQTEAIKAWEEADIKKEEEAQKEAEQEARNLEKELKKAEKDAKKFQKEIQQQIQQQMENNPIKPDTIKPNEILQQTLTPIKKKENIKTIELKPTEARIDAPVVEEFAPIPMGIN